MMSPIRHCLRLARGLETQTSGQGDKGVKTMVGSKERLIEPGETAPRSETTKVCGQKKPEIASSTAVAGAVIGGYSAAALGPLGVVAGMVAGGLAGRWLDRHLPSEHPGHEPLPTTSNETPHNDTGST